MSYTYYRPNISVIPKLQLTARRTPRNHVFFSATASYYKLPALAYALSNTPHTQLQTQTHLLFSPSSRRLRSPLPTRPRATCACMAAALLSHVVSDLCIGRPRVLTLPPSTPVAAALAALRTGTGADPFVFVDAEPAACRAKTTTATVYVKVSVADILCYLCGDAGNLRDPAAALGRPVAVVAAAVAAGHGVTHRVDPQTRYATQPARRRFLNSDSCFVPSCPSQSLTNDH